MKREPHVLLVEERPEQRSALVDALETRGCATAAAASAGGALDAIRRTPSISVVVVGAQRAAEDDRALVEAIIALRPLARVIVRADRPPVVGAIAVAATDVPALLLAVGACPHAPSETNSAADVVAASIDELEERWAELCRWDPAQPPDAEPTMPRTMLTAVADALRHPQPLGWGLDPALDEVVGDFVNDVPAPQHAIAQLACLRVALHDVVVRRAPANERDETLERVSAVLDHSMRAGATLRTSQLRDEALTDALTGLGNRRSFDRDLEREVARARRNGSPLTLALIDLDGLKRINDDDGHAAGDRALAAMGAALRATSRRSDRAYRIGGDEFAVLLSDAIIVEPERLAARLLEAGAPACSVGTASAPPEPLDDLFELADRELYRLRAEARGSRPT